MTEAKPVVLPEGQFAWVRYDGGPAMVARLVARNGFPDGVWMMTDGGFITASSPRLTVIGPVGPPAMADEIVRLREALREIDRISPATTEMTTAHEMADIARAALGDQ